MEVVCLNLLITSFSLRSCHANIMPSTNGCTSLRSDSSIPCRRSWSDKYSILIWSALIECSMAKGTCLFIPSVSVFIADFSGGHPPLTAGLELPSSLTLSGGSCVGILFFPLLFSLFINYIFGGQQAHWQSALPLKISGSTYSFVNPDYLPTVHTASERCSLHLRLPLVGICNFWAVFLPVVARSAGLPWWNLL